MTADAENKIEMLASAARRKQQALIAKRKKLIANLHGDLAKHGDPDRWKRYGDLLLANVNNAERKGDRIFVTDYFDPAAPTVEIEGEANRTISEVAESYFRRYAKARNGLKVIEERMAVAEAAIKSAEQRLSEIEKAVEAGDEEFLAALNKPKQKPVVVRQAKKKEKAFKGARRFVSSDGFEILVGKKAADNDYLTFRIARSLDLWLHAADYPGSHVVVRNQNRKEIPNRTLHEAAQVAAFYSDAREHPKAAVSYTQKKFVNKPRRAAAGLVSLASFKTILGRAKGAVRESGRVIIRSWSCRSFPSASSARGHQNQQRHREAVLRDL
jgi:predicted ribosome quality control (RQC) complex YloA/Tae2 family protein